MWFQAREDVIGMLKSKQTEPEALESRYGSAVPNSALQALQRDGFNTGTEPHNHSVYQKPMAEVSVQLGVTARLLLSANTLSRNYTDDDDFSLTGLWAFDLQDKEKQ